MLCDNRRVKIRQLFFFFLSLPLAPSPWRKLLSHTPSVCVRVCACAFPAARVDFKILPVQMADKKHLMKWKNYTLPLLLPVLSKSFIKATTSWANPLNLIVQDSQQQQQQQQINPGNKLSLKYIFFQFVSPEHEFWMMWCGSSRVSLFQTGSLLTVSGGLSDRWVKGVTEPLAPIIEQT